MKLNLILVAFLFIFLLIGCNGDNPETINSPEDALKMIEEVGKEREIHVYGSYEVNDDLVLIVFKGAMNDNDIWIADVHNQDGQWSAQEIVLMSGPFEGQGNIQTIIRNDEYGYEVGYMESSVTVIESASVIKIDESIDWKIWIRHS
ncbi:hypothetical protein ACFFHM_06205 [Halalkalibacter kiskunsagensis]|uniref:Uncharacterized protein n=1 Tax=Halalkalibacter kiskunsagensis TaxID=1548599 RepID=A0ABV6KB27_9BACI